MIALSTWGLRRRGPFAGVLVAAAFSLALGTGAAELAPGSYPRLCGAECANLRKLTDREFKAALTDRSLVSEIEGIVSSHPYIEAFCRDGRYFTSFGAQPVAGKYVLRRGVLCATTQPQPDRPYCRVFFVGPSGAYYWRHTRSLSDGAGEAELARFHPHALPIARECGRHAAGG